MKKINDVDYPDTFEILKDRPVHSQYVFGVRIMDLQQGAKLPVSRTFSQNAGRNLNIDFLIRFCCNKINFKRIRLTNKDLITTTNQFHEDDIFQNVAIISIPKAGQLISDTGINFNYNLKNI